MLSGVYTAVITPFLSSGYVDYASLKKILEYQNESNVAGVVILGSTAEEKSLSNSEKLKIIELSTQTIKGKQLFVGISCANINEAVCTIKKYEKYNFDGFLLGTPYYVRPTQEGLFRFFLKCAKSTTRKIILYNVPSRTAVSILPKLVQRLSKIENIVALKDATGNIEYSKEVLSLVKKDFSLLCGNDDMLIDMLRLGAVGCVSVISNILPNYPSAIISLTESGQQERAKELSQKYLDFIKALFIESNPICIKYIMSRVGYCNNVMRIPLTPISKDAIIELDKCFDKILYNIL